MQNKILLYPKPHVVNVPDNWPEMTEQERLDLADDYCIGLDFIRDHYLDLEENKDITELEKLYGKAK